MLYRVEVAGKIFQGEDPRVLLKRAVQARKNKKAIVLRIGDATRTPKTATLGKPSPR